MKTPQENAALKEAAQEIKLMRSRGDNGGSYDQAVSRFREEIATVVWDEEKADYVRAWAMPIGSISPVASRFANALAAWQA